MAQKRMWTRDLKEGMVVKADVFTRNGVIIVPARTVINQEVLELLARHSIREVFVEVDAPKPAEPVVKPEPVKPIEAAPVPVVVPNFLEEREKAQRMEVFTATFHVAEETLSQSLRELAYQDKDVNIDQLLNMVNSVVAKADNEVNLCDMLFKMKQSAESLYAHAINVSLYAQLLARWIGLSAEEIELVGIAGLLHDIGLLKCQQEEEGIPIYFHDEHDNEVRIWERHVVYGYNMIKDKPLDIRVKQAVLTHHERMDGRGFPHQMDYRNINTISKVLAIADTYDTLTLIEPDYEPLSPFEALRQLNYEYYLKLDADMIMTFVDRMAQNFIRYEVILSNGQRGRIVMINKHDQARPLVQVGDEFIDLSKQTDITIIKLLS
ncbi:MAG: HD domain-containing protein [Lachnospiraceae bacterium]|nr:HD domain-containing protein [Lachnospiraceae bacterium]